MKTLEIIGTEKRAESAGRALSSNPIRLRRQEGFSLTEVLVATAIFAIIFVAALMIYDRSNRVFKTGVEASDVQQNTRVAFDTMVADLRMAGFDYDRDGLPVGSVGGVAEEQQPDEQIEYVGRSAITIRANFDYEIDAANQYGREPDLESVQFPVVTTGNDEIVTYALRSADDSKNTDKVEFYADTSVPRNAFSGGSAESKITVPNVDFSNQNPPYTLYRFTLDGAGGVTVQPLADNIRSLNFTYYEDTTGQVPLRNISGTAELDQTQIDTILGGIGQYSPANPNAAINERTIRSKIRSVRLEVVGMNESIDGQFTDPYETVASAENYRKYRLESLIVPRNFGKRGMKEQSVRPPGPPTLDDVCLGLCGMAELTWTPHPEDGIYGSAEQFSLLADTANAGAWDPPQGPETGTTGWMSGLDPAATYYYAVRALNGYGSAESQPPYKSGQPQNLTALKPPSNLIATSGATALAGAIEASWNAPDGYVAGQDTLNCVSGVVKPAVLHLGEISGYEVWRGREDDFDMSDGVKIADYNSPTVVIDNATATASIVDRTASPCKSWYYRVRAVKAACKAPGTGPASPYSDFWPLLSDDGEEGSANSTGNPPKAPINLAVDTANSSTDSVNNVYIVELDWPAVTFDTANNPVGVDNYVVNRYRRKINTADPWVADPTWNNSSPHVTNGLDMGNSITYTDTTAELIDTVNSEGIDDGMIWEYQYTVQAQTCSDLSAPSVTATYPPPCEFTGSSVIQAGASSGTGTAANPWVMDAGDAISVTASGYTLVKVVFDVFDSTGSSVETVVDADGSDGFVYVWKDLVDNEQYRVLITATNDEDCIEQKERYVLDQAVSPCTVAPATPTLISSTTSGCCTTHLWGIQIDNTGSDNLNLQAITFTWADTTGSGATLKSIDYDGSATDTAFSQNTPGTLTESVPAGTLSVTPGDMSYIIAFGFEEHKNTPQLENPITKVCIQYTIATEPGVTKFCNVFGGTGGNNPAACD